MSIKEEKLSSVIGLKNGTRKRFPFCLESSRKSYKNTVSKKDKEGNLKTLKIIENKVASFSSTSLEIERSPSDNFLYINNQIKNCTTYYH